MLNKTLREQVLDKWTDLKTKAKKRKSENNSLRSENKVLAEQNDSLNFKVFLLTGLVSLGLVCWLAENS